MQLTFLKELQSIIDFFKIKAVTPFVPTASPFVTIQLENEEDAKKIASRSILIRSVFEFWTAADSLDKLYTQLETIPKDFADPYLKSKQSFRYQVSAFNKKLNKKEIVQIIDKLPLNFDGPVDLKNACESYHVLLDYGSTDKQSTDLPSMVYFGRWIADGQRDIIQNYHLKNRKFIANTSMDAQLSMIIANIAGVGPTMWVHDPFVGSGGLLVAAAHFGAYVSGTDIDYLLLHARAAPSRKNQVQREHDESIRANLRQYGCEHLYIDIMVADASKQGLWRDQTLFDAIITDPPYGIREGAKKTALDQPCRNEQNEKKTSSGDHNSKKDQYHLSDMFKDLLNFAAQHLYIYGRLVYWLPVVRKEYVDFEFVHMTFLGYFGVQTTANYTEDNIPTHPCFKLLYNCEQIINSKVSRRLITMEKIADALNPLTKAQMKVDHYENESFRKRYFTVDKSNEKVDKNICSKDENGQENVMPDVDCLKLDNT